MNPKKNGRIRRFTCSQRLFHLALMVLFLIQAATGLGRMYVQVPWGRSLCGYFGGYESALRIHSYVGMAMFAAFVVHVLYIIINIRWKNLHRQLSGPDSLVPRFKDIKDFFYHTGWIFGIGRSPEFDRWAYWEKFDYWAVFWGMIILGTTGMLLAFPIAASRLMPGWGLNVALWIHRIEALLAIGHVFIIHFFIVHLRRHQFPMDRAMFEGSADLETTRHEKAAWIRRLEKSRQLEAVIVSDAGPIRKIFHYILGYTAMFIGIWLLIGAIINVRRITW